MVSVRIKNGGIIGCKSYKKLNKNITVEQFK